MNRVGKECFTEKVVFGGIFKGVSYVVFDRGNSKDKSFEVGVCLVWLEKSISFGVFGLERVRGA